MPIVVKVYEINGNVIFEGGGSLKVIGTPSDVEFPDVINIVPGLGLVNFFPGESNPNLYEITINSGQANYGSGESQPATLVKGPNFFAFSGGIEKNEGFIVVPQGYINENPLSAEMTFTNQSFATLGIDVGIYEWTYILNSNGNSVTDTIRLEIIQPIICIFPGALVHTPSGYQKIEDLNKEDLVLDEHGQEIPLVHNVKCLSGHKGYVHFPKDLWGPGLPSAELIITDGHPIRPPNSQMEIPVEDLVDGCKILRTEGYIPETYSLVTKNRTFVLINNISVCTWSEKRFQEYTENEKLTYNLQ